MTAVPGGRGDHGRFMFKRVDDRSITKRFAAVTMIVLFGIIVTGLAVLGLGSGADDDGLSVVADRAASSTTVAAAVSDAAVSPTALSPTGVSSSIADRLGPLVAQVGSASSTTANTADDVVPDGAASSSTEASRSTTTGSSIVASTSNTSAPTFLTTGGSSAAVITTGPVRTSTSLGSTTTAAPPRVATTAAPPKAPSTSVRPSTTSGQVSHGPDYGFAPGGWFAHERYDVVLRDLDAMAEAGATWLRLDIDWPSIEPERGTYYWQRTDRVVEAANARGLQVLGLINESPAWARGSGMPAHAPPLDPADYARFAQVAVERYGSGEIAAWELWNEPNLAMFWSPAPDPEAYARLVIPAVAAIRAADSNAVVISGGLAPAADTADGSGISPTTFLTRMLAADAGVFDGYGIHPYSYPARPIDPSTAAWNPFTNLPRFRDLLESLGQSGKPIWLTEYGAPTGVSDRAVSEAEQSAQVLEAIDAANGWDWTGPLFIYSHRDHKNAPGDFQANFGLMRHDSSPKQAWVDLLALARSG